MTHYRLLCAAVALLGANTLFGEIINTQARVRTTVQELIDGSPGSVNADSVQAPGDDASFPLVATASLDTTELDGARTSIGQGLSAFEDPARLNDPNPQEFALETACYSNAPQVSYQVEGAATETRTVVFSRRELNLGPFDSTQEVTSRVFLSGAVLFWSKNPITPDRPLDAAMRFTIARDGDVEPLFTTSLLMAADVDPLAAGPIQFDIVELDELTELGVDEPSLAVLTELEQDGELLIIVIPPQEHQYRYPATVDQSTRLTATLDLRVANAPGGTGVAAVLGRPFEELAEFIEQALPGVNGEVVQRSLNHAAARRAIGLVSDTLPTPPAPRLCGADWLATIGMLLSLGLMRGTGPTHLNREP